MLFTPSEMGASKTVAATDSNVQTTITVPTTAGAMHIANCSATVHVTVRWGATAQTAVLGTSLTLPPMGQIVVGINPNNVAHLAAIGSAAGPTNVVFTPGNVA